MDMSRVRSSRSIDSSRRKSMVLDSSVNPISDALNEMERIKVVDPQQHIVMRPGGKICLQAMVELMIMVCP